MMTFEEQMQSLQQRSWFKTLSPADQAFLLREEERRRKEKLKIDQEQIRQRELQNKLSAQKESSQLAQQQAAELARQVQPSFSQPYSKPQYSIGASQYFDALNQRQQFADIMGRSQQYIGQTMAKRAQRRGLETQTQVQATERQVAEAQRIREQAQQRRSQIAQRRGELAAQREASQLAQQQAAELARQEADFRAKQRESDPYSLSTQRRILGVQAGLGMGGFGTQPFGSGFSMQPQGSGFGVQPQSIASQPIQSITPQLSQPVTMGGPITAQEQLDEARAKSQLAFLPQFDALRGSIASRIARRMGATLPNQTQYQRGTVAQVTRPNEEFPASAGYETLGSSGVFAQQPRLSGFQNTPRLSGFQFGTSPFEPSRYFAGYIRQ